MDIKLSDRVSGWSTLPTAALHGKILEMQKAGEDIIDLLIGISNRPIPKVGEKAAIDAIKNNEVPYTAIGGSSELKKAIQQKLKRENNINCNPLNIIATTGAKQAIFQALYAITNPDDEIWIPQPCWPAYTQIATMLRLKPHFISLDEISNLEQEKISPKLKLFVLNNPQNPTGKIFTEKELNSIAEFAKKNNLFVLADESYEKLNYEKKHVSFLTVAEHLKDQIITIFSVSQSFSMMGWRLGYAVANKQIIQAMESVQSSITAGTSAVTQSAVTAILEHEGEYLEELTGDFKGRRDAVFQKLADIEWVECKRPDSGPYFWCNIEKITKDSLTFCTKLLEKEKIAIMPGEAFGSPGWVRIAFNIQPIPVLEKAAEKIKEFGGKYGKT